MKTKNLLIAAALFLAAAATAYAQVTPTLPQTGGTMNQTTIPPAAPSNPGTLDQRTPTTNPTQLDLGTIDHSPVQRPTPAEEQSTQQRTGSTTQPTNTATSRRRDTRTKQQAAPETTTPRP